jgi:hypothetical protein
MSPTRLSIALLAVAAARTTVGQPCQWNTTLGFYPLTCDATGNIASPWGPGPRPGLVQALHAAMRWYQAAPAASHGYPQLDVRVRTRVWLHSILQRVCMRSTDDEDCPGPGAVAGRWLICHYYVEVAQVLSPVVKAPPCLQWRLARCMRLWVLKPGALRVPLGTCGGFVLVCRHSTFVDGNYSVEIPQVMAAPWPGGCLSCGGVRAQGTVSLDIDYPFVALVMMYQEDAHTDVVHNYVDALNAFSGVC